MHDDPVVIALVARARDGDQDAWNEIVERYAPLVWSICSRYGLSRHDIDDIGQTVWLLLVEQLGKIKEPAALPGWLATTTHRACMRAAREARRYTYSESLDETQIPLQQPPPTVEEEILAAELSASLRAAFGRLPPACRRLLSMLMCDPPLSYQEISEIVPIPIGSIGPQRKRCLQRLRRFLSSAPDPPGARTSDDGGGPND
jgi:RNA polymerase sigma factor (sigma-70 family)